MDTKIFKCSLCYGTETEENLMVICHEHEAHITCVKVWFRNKINRFAADYRVCVVCERTLKDDQLHKVLKPNYLIDEETMNDIQSDDVSAIRRLLESGEKNEWSDEFYSTIVRRAVEFESKKILVYLSEIRHRLFASAPLYLYLYKNRSYLGTCWLLGDFWLNPDLLASRPLLDLLMEGRCSWHPLLDIVQNCFLEFERADQLRILQFYLKPADDRYRRGNPTILPCLYERYTEYSCRIIDDLLIPATTVVDFEAVSKEDLLLVCPACNTDHFWPLTRQAMSTGNLPFLKLLFS